DWEELLAGKAVEILFYLDQPHTASELAERSDNYRNTVYRILTRFQERGIIAKTGTRYTVPEEFDLLVEFAREYVHHIHRNTVRDASPRATIIWEDTATFLIQTTDTIEESGYHPTGPTGFEQFGLPLLTTEDNYYFHTEEDWKLDPASLLCHTLLIDDGPRYRSYCLLLLALVHLIQVLHLRVFAFQCHVRSAVLKMDGVNLAYHDSIVVRVLGEYRPLDRGEFITQLIPCLITGDLFCFFLMPFMLFTPCLLRLRIRQRPVRNEIVLDVRNSNIIGVLKLFQ
ncbi:MAG: hypothetical protein SVU32_00020, partial [Candidatus Nanohaloarchaea archaeon]|nr:hypothetical protein [Candidatus Nanohaloarchaea archaeon]